MDAIFAGEGLSLIQNEPNKVSKPQKKSVFKHVTKLILWVAPVLVAFLFFVKVIGATDIEQVRRASLGLIAWIAVLSILQVVYLRFFYAATIKRRVREPIVEASQEHIMRLVVELQDKEQELHVALESKNDEASALYLYNLVHGTHNSGDSPVRFSHTDYFVVLLRLDEGALITKNVMREQRSYYSKRIIYWAERHLAPFGDVYGVELVSTSVSVAVLVNTPAGRMADIIAGVYEALRALQHDVYEEIGYTLSAGIGQLYNEEEDIQYSYYESVEAVKNRTIAGKQSITNWHESLFQNADYMYPAQIETQLINAIAAKKRETAYAVIDRLSEQLESVCADRIYYNINQLLNALVRYLLDAQCTLETTGESVQHLIDMVATTETLAELVVMLKNLVKQIIDELEVEAGYSGSYLPGIVDYIAAHFKEDINFEDMAQYIGISYSYMRRLVREQLKTSPLEMLHKYRIDEAKKMMESSELTLKVIAEEIGYKTMKSFERFFRKYEGVLPSEYRKAIVK